MNEKCKCPICEYPRNLPEETKSAWPPAKEMSENELRESTKNAARYHNDNELAQILFEAIGQRVVGVSDRLKDVYIEHYQNKELLTTKEGK